MSHMVKDIIKFLIIFFIVSIAFSAGLNEIYSFYSDVVDNICLTQLANATSPLTATDCDTENAFGEYVFVYIFRIDVRSFFISRQN